MAGYEKFRQHFPPRARLGMNHPSGHPPRINSAVNIKALPLEPEEAFVYSRVDGRSRSKDIALTTGLPLERVEKALRRLGELGALAEHGGSDEKGALGEHGAFDPRNAVSQNAAPRSSFVPVPDIDLSAAEQRAVYELWEKSSTLDHYELLGISRDASRNEIKDAYFRKVAAFHPDKHFGKRLGSYKEKLAVVFQRFTVAHDTLGRSRRREEYDATLPPKLNGSTNVAATSERPGVAAPTRSHQPSERPQTSVTSALNPADTQPSVRPSGPPVAPTLLPPHPPFDASPSFRPSHPSPSLRPPTTVPPERAPTPVPSVPPAAAYPSAPPGVVVQSVSSPAQRRAAPSVPPVSADQRRQLAAHSITRGLRHLGTKGVDSLKPRFSPKPGVPSPSSPPSAREHALEQARQAASRADWERAGALFAKIASAERDGHLFARAAECYAQAPRNAAGDVLRKAVECGRQAVGLAPNNVQFRLALSRLYAEAGLMKSALGEAERAQELSPRDKKVQSWVQHLKRRDAGNLR